jgi:perosamine synthetase
LIRVFEPRVTFSDTYSVIKTLINNNISGTSPTVGRFEKSLANKFERQHVIAVSNGSTALDLAFESLNLKKGDEVIVPSFTIISCLAAIIRTGATPIFCDVDSQSWNLTLENITTKFSEKTKAVLIVHLYGLAGEASKIEKFCKEKNVLLIEDSAEAHGQFVDGRPCGSFGDLSTMSFYANKHITTGEGGAVLTNNLDLSNKIKSMRNLGFNNTKRFFHENLYWNYRLGGLQAALGLSQIKNLENTIKLKTKQGKIYQELLSKENEFLETQLETWNGVDNHYWVFGVNLKIPMVRDLVMSNLFEKGIETRPFFWPLHLQPVLPEEFQNSMNNLTVSEKLGNDGLYIPIGGHINVKKQKLIVKELIESIKQYV